MPFLNVSLQHLTIRAPRCGKESISGGCNHGQRAGKPCITHLSRTFRTSSKAILAATIGHEKRGLTPQPVKRRQKGAYVSSFVHVTRPLTSTAWVASPSFLNFQLRVSHIKIDVQWIRTSFVNTQLRCPCFGDKMTAIEAVGPWAI
jgi:hypothetical protein